ncbi:MAG: nucleoside hydrolase [Oscillospiraceae bacterium]|nr:nucleoside hydrolase [Oscillospiraceae bacterium]
MRKKILFDTDIGSDIDDAVCLAYLLCNSDCELAGITTVSGQARERAMLCDALCKAANKSVPIHAGTEKPLLIDNKQTRAQQAEKLANHPHSAEFAENTAIEFMRDVIYQNPGEITLLAVGPTTNVGLLFATYPKTVELLGGLALMCGDFLRGGKAMEWNAICDPHACAIVYNAPVKSHVSYGLNVTTLVTMSSAEVRERFAHPVLKVVADFAEVWFRERDRLTFHDPLAAVGVFCDDVMKYERGAVDVDIFNGEQLGRTVFTANAAGPHTIASEVSPDRFFDRYFSVFG